MFFSSVSKGRGQGYAATESDVIRQLSRTGVIGGPSNGYRRHQNRVREIDQQNQKDTELYAQSVRDNAAMDSQTLWTAKHTEDLQRRTNNNNSDNLVTSSFDDVFDIMTTSTHLPTSNASPSPPAEEEGTYRDASIEKKADTENSTSMKRERSNEGEGNSLLDEEGVVDAMTTRPKKKRNLLSKFE